MVEVEICQTVSSKIVSSWTTSLDPFSSRNRASAHSQGPLVGDSHVCFLLKYQETHMGLEGVLNWKKKHPSFLLMPNSHKLRKDSKNVNLKIRSWGPQKLGSFSHFSSWEKQLSSGQKWFLKPYFLLFRGMFVFRSGLRFSFRALEVPEPRVSKRSF